MGVSISGSESTQEIQRIQIVLQTDKKILLHIVMASDGLIQRPGSGHLDNDEHQLISDHTDIKYFKELLDYFPDGFYESEGSYSDPDLRGERLGLNIVVIINEQEHYFQIVYGSESEGPPDDIVSFVIRARQLTESWYQSLKSLGSNG